MHEFALAEAIVTATRQAAAESGMEHVDRVVVTIGELQQIRSDLFEFSLTQVIPQADAFFADTEFQLEQEAASFDCRACGRQFGRSDLAAESPDDAEAAHFVPELSHAFVRCPDCSSPDFEITAGRGITLRQIEGRNAEGEE